MRYICGVRNWSERSLFVNKKSPAVGDRLERGEQPRGIHRQQVGASLRPSLKIGPRLWSGIRDLMVLEILHRTLVSLRSLLCSERTEVAPTAGFRILLARIEAELPGL